MVKQPIDGLSNEHLLHSHPIVSVILSRLFMMIIHSCYIPAGFKMSYIVPIPKLKDARSKALTCKCNDFRGIAISPVISKLFEYCFLDRFQSVFATESNQFGFKKGNLYGWGPPFRRAAIPRGRHSETAPFQGAFTPEARLTPTYCKL